MSKTVSLTPGNRSDVKSEIDDPMKEAKNTDKAMKSKKVCRISSLLTCLSALFILMPPPLIKKKLRKEKDLFFVKFRILNSLPPERNSTIVQRKR
jgi:hypothetical protein